MLSKIKFFISILLPLLIWALPTAWIPLDGLTLIEHRLLAIFAMATLFWVLEPIPLFATSLLIIFLELVLISNQSFILFRGSPSDPAFGKVLDYKEIMATFASPIILLFLGGFFLAMASTKYRLDINLARVLLKPFGKRPSHILFGLMCITALFSMFMSNTATTAMMLAILMPILASFDGKDPGKTAFALSIPFAANIGGIGTPIGTPPNVIAFKYLTGKNVIGFGTWMAFAVPYALVMLVFAWILLQKFFPFQKEEMELKLSGKFLKNKKAYTVYFIFALTVFLWLFDFLHGMNSYVVAMIPVTVFSATKIITTEDLRKISWHVLWLVAGGIALGSALEKTGLASRMVSSIDFSLLSPYVIVLLASVLSILMATFMSHTATANLLLPMMAILGSNISTLAGLGGSKMLILGVTFSCSLAMSFPVSTPPNAIAHSTGIFKTKDMAKIGSIIGIVGILGLFLMLYILKKVHFL